MERVAFLIEETNERLGCLLNPEALVIRRLAGVQPRRSLTGTMTGSDQSDDPLFFTGGGRTVLELALLFDVTLLGSSLQTDDVRTLTAPFWRLAENSANRSSYGHPPQVRFIWGKAWNIPGVIEAVAERFDRFTRQGVAQRSWLSLRMVRVNEPSLAPLESPAMGLADLPENATLAAPTDEWGAALPLGDGAESERLDQLAAKEYGNPSLWRLLAVANNIDNPTDVPVGTVLRVPPASLLGTESQP